LISDNVNWESTGVLRGQVGQLKGGFHRLPRSPQGNPQWEAGVMSSEDRISRIEAAIDKQNEGIQTLIVVARTVLTSIQEFRTTQERGFEEMRELHRKAVEEMREMSKATDEKLNILVETVDKIIRHRLNGHEG
jgi:methyl-accepting chemotaxis protein